MCWCFRAIKNGIAVAALKHSEPSFQSSFRRRQVCDGPGLGEIVICGDRQDTERQVFPSLRKHSCQQQGPITEAQAETSATDNTNRWNES